MMPPERVIRLSDRRNLLPDKIKGCHFGHPFVLYIKFKNQTYRSGYEFPGLIDQANVPV